MNLVSYGGKCSGYFKVTERRLTLVVTNKKGNRVHKFDVVVDDLEQSTRLIEFAGQPVLVHFNLVDSQTIKIQQAERLQSEHQPLMYELCFVINGYPRRGRLDGSFQCKIITPEIAAWYPNPSEGNPPIFKEPTTDLSFPPEWCATIEGDKEFYKNMMLTAEVTKKGEGYWLADDADWDFHPFGQWVESLQKPNAVQALPGDGPVNEQEETPKRPKVPNLTPAQRYKILLRDGFRCQDCGASANDDPLVRLEVDHRWSKKNGGDNDPENLQTLCWNCNRGKGAQNDHKLGVDPWEQKPLTA